MSAARKPKPVRQPYRSWSRDVPGALVRVELCRHSSTIFAWGLVGAPGASGEVWELATRDRAEGSPSAEVCALLDLARCALDDARDPKEPREWIEVADLSLEAAIELLHEGRRCVEAERLREALRSLLSTEEELSEYGVQTIAKALAVKPREQTEDNDR